MNNTSFRDNAGFVFLKDEKIYRQINKVYKEDYDFFINSGLYDALVNKNFLVKHKEVELEIEKNESFYKFIFPEQIQYITYPYEWSFSALKDAALLTLDILQESLNKNMILKDASSYNIQFKEGKPIFIDTLSFRKYKENEPWEAYRQFCRHFLAPLALMSYTDINLNQLLITNIDGIPLDLVVKLLPFKAKFNLGLFTHIYMHASCQKQNESKSENCFKAANLSRYSLYAIIDNLKSTIKNLSFPKITTEWGEYYGNTNYSEYSFENKKYIINDFLEKINPKTLCDLGANVGLFSRIASEKGITTLAFDIDPNAIEANYQMLKQRGETTIFPLLQDLTNPSPDIGFSNDERKNFTSRFKSDVVMALALIHHLSISNNLPFENTALYFQKLCKYLIIEFVPKSDSKVQLLLSSRDDIFVDYNCDSFENTYKKHFTILDKRSIEGTERILYLMRSNNG